MTRAKDNSNVHMAQRAGQKTNERRGSKTSEGEGRANERKRATETFMESGRDREGKRAGDGEESERLVRVVELSRRSGSRMPGRIELRSLSIAK